MLDPKSLTFIASFTAFISALYFIPVWRVNRFISGVSEWTLSIFSFAIALFLLSLQTEVHFFYSIILANHFLLLAFVLSLIGSLSFFDVPIKRGWMYCSYFILFTPLFSYFVFIDNNVNARIILVSAMWLMSQLIVLVALRKSNLILSKISRAVYISVSIYIIVLMFFRIYLCTIGSGVENFLAPNTLNIVTSLAGFLVPYGLVLSFSFLCNDRKEFELNRLKLKAEQELDQKSKFLAAFSHEIRTPLNGIVGLARLMHSRMYSDEDKKDCETIIQTGIHLGEFSSYVLQSAQVEHHSHRESETIALLPWLMQLLNLVKSKEKALCLTVELNYTLSKDFTVSTDTLFLRHILVNLLDNSIKYTEHGFIRLSVSISETNLFFEILDSGIGIPKGEINNLIQPFTWASNHGWQDGAGLGLALSQDMLTQVGSTLKISSKEGKGSSFSFNFPYIEQPVVEKKSQSINAIPSLRILLIEDIPLNQKVTKGLLEIDNHLVTIAESGEKAMHEIEKQSFDFIFLDMNLPDINGERLFEYFKSLKLTSQVIALTARVDYQSRLRYQEIGLQHVLAKPVDIDMLRNTLNSLVNLNYKFQGNNSQELFNKEVFRYLRQVLSVSEIIVEVSLLKIEVLALIEGISNVTDTEHLLKQISLHKIANKTAQFGLTAVSKTALDLELYHEVINEQQIIQLTVMFNESIVQLETIGLVDLQ
ncbi:response regulator [Pseudoalteromonas tunicata]|uniref:histidine kinase n=1 Tax=Pseudoalteromonas tunicata D2 TaxID=87626 RepID=A4C7I0_9GAMM|nr:response regulator [Pseudoalteromonas tunicata]ATC95904.1 hypothetical protein PTUN_a3603 [Pseudoalteromonas tunicata]AXT31447.1 hybrid sensor histidine kinase/response regulator [Pseudoalteromonas tunicata]EAR29934.1 putative control sensor/kinase protein (ArcB, TorS, ChiS, LuxQ, BvgS family) [Pseudoalteromonas tunicata D2]